MIPDAQTERFLSEDAWTLHQQFLHYIPGNISKPEIAAHVVVGEAFVVEAEAV